MVFPLFGKFIGIISFSAGFKANLKEKSSLAGKDELIKGWKYYSCFF
jgi:hypothetical protein